jgi:uncharacterized protein (DUF983 family)
VTHTNIQKGQPGIFRAALFGFCPRCGAQTLFASVTRFNKTCAACELDYTRFSVGDGPAALMIIPIGAIIITLAIILDIAVRPPFWVHALIWVPLTAMMVFALLRLTKGFMLILEYRNKAGEAQNANTSEDLP